LKSAATIISSDLEYAKSMAISRGKQYSVVFNTGAESYQIEDANGVISHPVRKGSTYTVNFAADSRLSRVDISSVTFDASNTTIGFNYLGSPQADGSYLNSEGEIVLSAGGSTMTVNVEPVTGYITISN
jgi:sugar lactone lactonase YvrE